MDKIKKFAVEIVIIIIVLIIGWISRGCYDNKHRPEKPEVEKEGKTKTVYIREKPNAEYCGPFEINGAFLSFNIFRVEAKDGCKTGQKDFTFKYPAPKVYHHSIIGSYGPAYHIEDSTFRHFISGQYLYNFNNHIGIGGGAFAIFGQSKLHDIGPQISAKIQF